MIPMRAVNIFLFFILMTLVLPVRSQDLEQYFLRPSDQTGNGLTRYFRTHTVKLYDSMPCHERVFYSHLATPAPTLPGNRLAYEPFPGARFDGFLMNSLSMGLWNGMQIGFVPLFYLFENDNAGEPGTSEHLSNMNLKWNLFSFKNFEVAYAFSILRMKSNFLTPITLPSGTFNDAEITYTWSTLVLNYFFENLPLGLGVNFSSVALSSKNKDLNEIFEKQNTNSEYIVDLNYILNSNWAFTAGAGKMKETAFELEKAYYGFGGTVTYVRNKKWFNQISLGVHHFNTIDADKFLFSFSI